MAEPASATDIDDDCIPAEPILIHLDVEPVTESYVEIVDVKSGHRVVTAIEVLSPTNKRPTEGQRLYLKKRDDLKLAGVNTVEIDLLRGGDRVLMAPSSAGAAVTSHCLSGVHLAGSRNTTRLPFTGSRFESGCQSSRSRSGRRTGKCHCPFRRSSTNATATGATTISTIAASPTRRFRPTMQRGPTHCYGNRAGGEPGYDTRLNPPAEKE